MATLLSVLTSRNPHLDTSKVPWGPNTELDLDFEPLGWVPWVEFSYDNLTEIFREQLKARYDDSSTNNVSALPLDLEICNEHTLELALHRFIMPTPVNWEMNSPEYAIVRWDAHGSKRLTIKLALWCLAMMAVKGGNSIDCSYPALNSWRIEGDRYTHNASGASKTRLGHRDVVQGLDPEAISDWQYAEEETSTSGYGDGSQEDEQEEEENEASEYGEDDIEDARSIHETAGDPGPELHGGESDTGPVGSGNGSRDSDTETIVAGLRRMRVTIKKRMLSRRPYFVDARGRDIDTDITEWTRVRHHYELAGRRHVYVADTFPE
ncbi:hypothetical protein Sste5346_009193 [Sporothrix stenoceras]|uniref:Uncharacterized protein n=1 Tax=Sporothrix stenoceras TaxID=5173 RepID=A0ABR3YKZ6_9PEZI